MRSVVVSLFLSLDGVAEDPHRFAVDWDDDAMDAHMAGVLAEQDTVLLGRRSYEEWAPYWPTSDIEPFASFVNAVPKYIATSTPLDVEWAGSHVIEGDLADFVRDLRERPGGDIGVHASISVAQTLLAADLVDQLTLAILPTVAGSGRRLLDGVPAHRLDPVRVEASAKGTLLGTYRIIR